MRLVGQQSNACRLAREQVSLHLDGELSEFERVALDGHLASCASCRAYQASASEVSAHMRSSELEEPEFPFVLPHRARIRMPLRTAQVAAAAAVVAIVGFAGAGLTGGGRSVSLGDANTFSERGSSARSERTAQAAVEFRIERRIALRPVRGGATAV